MKLALTAVIAFLSLVDALAAPRKSQSKTGTGDNGVIYSDPSEIYINGNPTYRGTGCPDGSAVVDLTPDRKSFTVMLSKFKAAASPDMDRNNCQLNIDMRVPAGFQYTVFNATYRGYVDIDQGVSATLSVSKIIIPPSFETYFSFSHDSLQYTDVSK
jgi:hypothetical protein